MGGGGGGGGVMDRLIPGYKDKLWNRLSPGVKKNFISRQHAKFEKDINNRFASAVSACKYNSAVAATFAPDYNYRAPIVDYKRQFARGTLLEGRDFYFSNEEDKKRLYNVEEPYSKTEEEQRQRYARYDFKLAFGLVFGGLLFWDYRQSRPVAWCIMLNPTPPRQPWYHKAMYHGHDVKSVRRGFEVFRAVCSTCHSLRKCKWWYLMKDVYPVRRVQEFAAEKTMVDGLNKEGEINIRPCMTWDYFPKPFPNEEAAKEANNGKEPPDFSEGPYYYRGGADYFFALLTGFRDPPVGVTLTEHTYYNPWFCGSVIGMPPPLENGIMEFEDGTPATVSQMAKDVVSFLTFVADPSHTERNLWALKGLVGLIWAWPCFYALRRYSWSAGWNRRVDFDKIRPL